MTQANYKRSLGTSQHELLMAKIDFLMGLSIFRLLKHQRNCIGLQIGRIAMASQDLADHHPNFCPRRFANGPVNRYALADLGHQIGCNHLQLVKTHCLHCRFVLRQRVVKTKLVLRQAQIFVSFIGIAHLAGQCEQLFDNFLGGNRPVMIGIHRALQHLAHRAPLNHISLGAKLDLVLQEPVSYTHLTLPTKA